MKQFLILFFSAIVLFASAQDTIVKKNGEVIRAKILEVGTDEVKFKIYGDTASPIIIVKNADIKTAKVAGQTIINSKDGDAGEDIIVKKNGDQLKVKVIDIGTEEVKFKLASNPDGPTISVKKSEIRTMKVDGQTVIDVKKTGADEDVIVKKDGTTVKVKIVEVGSDEVKYKVYTNPDGPTLSMKKTEVQTVKVEGQVVYEYKEDPRSISNNAILDKETDIKFHFFSPLYRHLAFDGEWVVKPGYNWEVGFGIIGPGIRPVNQNPNYTYSISRDPKGLFLRFGPKFLIGSSSDIEVEGGRYAHPLKGRYIKPEIILTSMAVITTQDTGYYGNWGVGKLSYKEKYQALALNLIYGRQFILGNTITVGYYIGIGYAFENKTAVGTVPKQNWYDSYDPRRYSYIYMGRNFPLTFTSGFTIGYIMRTPDWLKSKSSKKMPNRPPSRHSMDEQ